MHLISISRRNIPAAIAATERIDLPWTTRHLLLVVLLAHGRAYPPLCLPWVTHDLSRLRDRCEAAPVKLCSCRSDYVHCSVTSNIKLEPVALVSVCWLTATPRPAFAVSLSPGVQGVAMNAEAAAKFKLFEVR